MVSVFNFFYYVFIYVEITKKKNMEVNSLPITSRVSREPAVEKSIDNVCFSKQAQKIFFNFDVQNKRSEKKTCTKNMFSH